MSHELTAKNGLVVEGNLSATGSIFGTASYSRYMQPTRVYQRLFEFLKAQQELTRSNYQIFDGFVDDFADFTGAIETGSFVTYGPSSIYNNANLVIPGVNAVTASVTLLCHFDGTHGDTTTTDSGPLNLPLSASASPFLISDTNKKFGPTSIYFSGSNRALKAGQRYAFDISASQNFTVEWWMSSSVQGAAWQTMFSYDDAGGGNQGHICYVSSNGFAPSPSKLNYEIASTGVFGSTTIAGNGWHHIAIVRSGSSSNNVKGYVDGNQEFQFTYTGYVTASNAATLFIMGASRNGDTTDPYIGYMDEFMYLIGHARYTGSAVVPFAGGSATISQSMSGSLISKFRDLAFTPTRVHSVMVAQLLTGSFTDASSGSFVNWVTSVSRLSGSGYATASFGNLVTWSLGSPNIFAYGATTDLRNLPVGNQIGFMMTPQTASTLVRLLGFAMVAEQ